MRDRVDLSLECLHNYIQSGDDNYLLMLDNILLEMKTEVEE